jgi:hypothetical protein
MLDKIEKLLLNKSDRSRTAWLNHNNDNFL